VDGVSEGWVLVGRRRGEMRGAGEGEIECDSEMRRARDEGMIGREKVMSREDSTMVL